MAKGYWRRVHWFALRRAVEVVMGSPVTIAISALTLLVVLIGLAFFGSQDAAGDERLTRSMVGIASVGALFSIYMYWFCRTPGDWDKEKSDEITALNKQLEPTLSLSVPENYNRVVKFGSTSHSMGGNKFINVKQTFFCLYVSCTNISGIRAADCRAHLVDVKRLDDGGEEDVFVESVQLSWSEDRKTFSVDMPPNSTYPIFLLQCLPGVDERHRRELHLFRDSDIPFNYQTLFRREGKYRLSIIVSADQGGGEKIDIDVEWLNGPQLFDVSKV